MTIDMPTLVIEASEGKPESIDQLFQEIYSDLKKMAHRIKFDWRHAYTLNTTALVHESYLKLLTNKSLTPLNKLHFIRLSGKAMRFVLRDYLEKRQASKRSGELVEINEQIAIPVIETEIGAQKLEEVLSGLARLEQEDTQPSKVVECRFFADMTVEETSTVLGISQATVKRKWSFAKAFLSKSIKNCA